MTLSERFQARFSRRTTSGHFIPEADGLRFPALMMVLIGHVSAAYLVRGHYPRPPVGLLNQIAAFPEQVAIEGLLIFFVISGFLLGLPFARFYRGQGAPVSLKRYFLRRLTRVEPPYFVTLGVITIVAVVATQLHVVRRFGTVPEILRHAGASALYMHNLVFASSNPIDPPMWSLEIEVQFYILVPLLAKIFSVRSVTRRRAAICVAALVATLVSIAVSKTPGWSVSILEYMQYFLVGFLLVDIYIGNPGFQSAPRSLAWDGVSMLGWSVMIWIWQWKMIAAFCVPMILPVVYCAAFRGTLTNKALTNAWIATAGGMCYSIYLVHVPMGALVAYEVGRVVHPAGVLWLEFLREGMPVLLLTLVPCVLFFLVIERPCMNPDWPARLLSRVRRSIKLPVPRIRPASDS